MRWISRVITASWAESCNTHHHKSINKTFWMKHTHKKQIHSFYQKGSWTFPICPSVLWTLSVAAVEIFFQILLFNPLPVFSLPYIYSIYKQTSKKTTPAFVYKRSHDGSLQTRLSPCGNHCRRETHTRYAGTLLSSPFSCTITMKLRSVKRTNGLQ